MNVKRTALAAGIGLFGVWSMATWVLEGRIQTLLRPEAVIDRIVYALVGNLLLGIGVGLAGIVYFVRNGAFDAESAGLGSMRRTLAAVAAGLALGFGLYVVLSPPTMHPVVILNAFSQVFVVSAAEVVVCWAVVGVSAEAVLGREWRKTVQAALVAAVLFGLYHFAHSPPFNTWTMVGFLTIVGLGTGAFFFVSRDVLGTALFHNFLGTLGVLQALAKADALSTLERVQPTLIGTAAVGVGTLLALRFVARKQDGSRTHQPVAA